MLSAAILPFQKMSYQNMVNIVLKNNSQKYVHLVRKNLYKSWTSIPHVTHFEEIDLTQITLKRKAVNASVLSYVIDGICKALKEFPVFNSSLY